MKDLSLIGGWKEVLSKARVTRSEAANRRVLPVRLDLPRASGKITVARTAAEARSLAEALQSTPLSAIAFDSEYRFERPGVPLRGKKTWQDIHSQRPICVSLAAWCGGGEREDGHVLRAVIDVRERGVVPWLSEILRIRVPLVFHHVKAELFTFWRLGLDPELLNLYDTQLAAAAIHLGRHHRRARRGRRDESEAEEIRSEAALRRKKDHLLSLAGQCAHYRLHYPHSDSKDELREIFLNLSDGEPLTERMLEYASADAEWTLRLYVAQAPDLQRRGLHQHLHTVEFPFAVANARMEWRGVYIAPERRERLRDGARNAASHYAARLREFGIDPPGSRPQFLRLMESEGLLEYFRRDGKLSTRDDFLETRERLHPAVRAFRLHGRYRRLASEEWLSGSLTGADERTHPDHYQLGTDTGRNSCKSPNIAGIGKVHRPVVTAPRGRALVELDYSQIEVGVAAAEYGDEDLVSAYNSGDVYAAMAQRFFAERLTEEERALSPEAFKARRPELRDRMKPFVLSVIYNIQAEGLALQFRISRKEAERERRRFLNLYPALKRRLEESAVYGASRGYATIVSGLRRVAEKARRPDSWTRNFLRNTPIQGGAAVVFKHAVVLLDRAFRGTDTWIVLPVHDAVVIECPREETEEVSRRAPEIMKDALRTYYPRLVPKVEVNSRRPDCWNKDGHAESLERFLEDPTFQIGGDAGEDSERVEDGPRPHPERDEIDRLFAELFEERAAILEFETGLPREKAEAQARAVALSDLSGHLSTLAEGRYGTALWRGCHG